MLAFAPSPEDIAWLLVLYLVVPIGWITGLICFRRRGRHMLLWTALVTSFYVGFILASRTGRYSLTVQILDPERRPIPSLTVSYSTHPQSDRFGRFSTSLRGEATTDSAGQIFLRPNHAHGISFTVRDPKFGYAGFRMEAAGRRYGHQIYPDKSVTFIEPSEPPPATGTFHGTWVFDAQPQHRIVVAMKPK